jgi:hypothetical protein
MKKRLLLAALVVLVAACTLVAAGPALAGPDHSVLVMNVTYKVVNDQAPSGLGYWALQTYTRQVKVWQMPDGTFSWASQFEGKWATFAGAMSPGGSVTQAADGSGTFKAILDGTFTSDSCIPVFGYLGAHDFGGSRDGVLSQIDTPTPWSCGIYFPGATADGWSTWVTTAYRYSYSYKGQTFVFDATTGVGTGDIVIK